METQNIEYKESWNDKYLKWICGFANAQGGKIYIGKDDSGKAIGLPNAKDLSEEIPNKIRNRLGIIVDVNLLTENDKTYIEIDVEPQPYPISFNGEYHYRSGSTKQVLIGHQLNHFIMKKTGLTWDSVPMVKIDVEKMRNDSFDIFREMAVKNNRMSESDVNISNKLLLDSLNLLDDGNMRRAGVLLFHHKPEKWIMGAYVKIGYFENDADIIYQDEIHGSLLHQAEATIDLLYTKYFKAMISYEGITRVEKYPYPKEAIREVVLNAIAHKDYATFIPIQIKVYDDKLVVSNDCVFPEKWTKEDLLKAHKSIPYNPLIAQTFYRAGLIESWGTGIQKIRNSCLSSGNDFPKFLINPDEVTVVFKSLFSDHYRTIEGSDPTIEGTDPTIEGTDPTFEDTDPTIDVTDSTFDDVCNLLSNVNCNNITKDRICRLYSELCDYADFGRGDVVRILQLKPSAVTGLIKRLRELNLIESVVGKGKGRYKFVRIKKQQQ